MAKRTQLEIQLDNQHIERMKPFEVEPPKEYKTGKAKRYYQNQCHKKAFEYMLHVNPDKGVLVQGVYTENGFSHSWVELPDDIVFDGVLQRFYSKQDYYREQQAIKIVEFTRLEAMQEATQRGYSGEWFDYIGYITNINRPDMTEIQEVI